MSPLFKRMPLAAVITVLVTGSITGCNRISNPFVKKEEPVVVSGTLGELLPAEVDRTANEGAPVNIDDVIDSYSELITLADDPDIKMRGLQRLADLRLEKGETAFYDGADTQLDLAAESYEGLLSSYPDRIENDRVRYQLAKTRDLQGNMEGNLAVLNGLVLSHPDSPYLAETQFRRGDMLFSKGDFVGAREAFDAVIETQEPQFLNNAHYMRGWCDFKLLDYQQALVSFTRVLDRVMPEDMQTVKLESQNETLVEDLLRVMGFAFSYLGGAESVPELFAQTGPKRYEFLVYDRYAQLLVKQELYSDAILVYRKFIEQNPHSLYAPQYQVSIIKTLEQGGFVNEVQVEKARFVEVYGKDSAFWLATNPVDLTFTEDRLEMYLPELAAVHYNLGQNAVAGKSPAGSKISPQEEFEKAAQYYGAFADTFPQKEKTPEMLLLLGESLSQLNRWEAAIEPWERAGYSYPDYDKSSEAAYAALLAHGKVLASYPVDATEPELIERRRVWKEKQLKSRLDFVQYHAADSRALDVLYQTTVEMYGDKAYNDVISLGARVLAWQPAPPAEMQTDTQLLIAHSEFAQGDYLQAETDYQKALVLLPPNDPRREGVVENLAASVYRQGENLLAAGNRDLAVSEYLRVATVAPSAELRRNAQFDAANLLIESKRWDEAVDVLVDFRKRYPDHALTASIPGKLALAYQETGQTRLAADEFALMVVATQDPEQRRERLLIAADLYDKAEDIPNTLKSYREYAEKYPLPAEDYMEAVDRLTQLYAQTGQTNEQRFWLQKQVEAYDRQGSAASDRMRYLAAGAAAVLADDAYQTFLATRLSLPLNKSLVQKTETMKQTVAAYKQIAGYGVAEFATLAGYRMAEVYAQLSRDLMDSERPDNLDEMALEQYDLLLEEQAYPFEENAIAIHEQNIQKSWNGVYDEWVKASFDALSRLLPARYGKQEAKRDVYDVAL